MTLNLITCLFRSGNLATIKASIPEHEDINWIIVLSDNRQDLKDECKSLGLTYYTIPEPDPDTSSLRGQEIVAVSTASLKVNEAIKHLKHGFFSGLDDDTTFNPNAYIYFHKLKDKYKMIIGAQKLKDGGLRVAQEPKPCYTDGSQGIIHTDIVKNVFFDSFTTNPVADYKFLNDCWNSVKPEERYILNEVVSNYNFLK